MESEADEKDQRVLFTFEGNRSDLLPLREVDEANLNLRCSHQEAAKSGNDKVGA